MTSATAEIVLTERSDGRRILLFEDGEHVATIYEVASPKEAKAAGQRGALYNWYVRNHGGRADSKDDAVRQIKAELAK